MVTFINTDCGDFGALLDGQTKAIKNLKVSVGDKIKGVISAIDNATIFIDLNAKMEAVMDRLDCVDGDGNLTVKVGDTIEAMCVAQQDGEIRLSRRAGKGTDDSAIEEAYAARVPIEGRVNAEIKGGFEVMIGTNRGFCPYSQMDLFKKDAATYLGQKLMFLVREYAEGGRRLVLSRRTLLEAEQEKQREHLRETLAIGDRISGAITRVMPFGAFVSLGAGIEGLIPAGELAWKRGIKPEDVVAIGQAVEVDVIGLDWGTNRIALSLKAATPDPWEEALGRFVAGTRHTGTVTQLMPFGAFVELAPGVEGLIPISKLGQGRRLQHASEAVKPGEKVEIVVEAMDADQHRLSLGLIAVWKDGEPPVEFAPVQAGQEVAGTVEAVRDFGVFVRLPDNHTGLLHLSQLGLPEGPTRLRNMHNQYPAGKAVQVVVKSIDGGRISLALPHVRQDSEADEIPDPALFSQAPGTQSLGVLGGMVDFSKLTIE
jgi:small subunit ribosomal protein S1